MNRTAMLVPVSEQIPSSLQGACHSYIDELMPIATRREALKKKYQFDCACEGCLDEERNIRMEAWSCGICVGGLVPNKEGASCTLCGWTMSRDHYELCRAAEEAAIASRPKIENDFIALETKKQLCEKLIELFQDTIHTFNVHRIPFLRCLYIASLAAQE
uniref:SET domain-containing protein n=3 Tax=Caenorhabditis japonica TaxID=281687 RepID=A0A8R1DGV4_CAEJA